MAKYKILTPNDIIDIPENRERSDFTIPNLKGKEYKLGKIYSGPIEEGKGDANQSRVITNNSGFDLTYFTFDNPKSPLAIKHTLKNGESVRLYTKSEQEYAFYWIYSYDYIEAKSNIENVYCANIE